MCDLLHNDILLPTSQMRIAKKHCAKLASESCSKASKRARLLTRKVLSVPYGIWQYRLGILQCRRSPFWVRLWIGFFLSLAVLFLFSIIVKYLFCIWETSQSYLCSLSVLQLTSTELLNGFQSMLLLSAINWGLYHLWLSLEHNSNQ